MSPGAAAAKLVDGVDLSQIDFTVLNSLDEDTGAREILNLFYDQLQALGLGVNGALIAKWMWKNQKDLNLTPKQLSRVSIAMVHE